MYCIYAVLYALISCTVSFAVYSSQIPTDTVMYCHWLFSKDERLLIRLKYILWSSVWKVLQISPDFKLSVDTIIKISKKSSVFIISCFEERMWEGDVKNNLKTLSWILKDEVQYHNLMKVIPLWNAKFGILSSFMF